MSDVFELFPTPLMHLPGLLDAAQVAALVERFAGAAQQHNPRSGALAHTGLMRAEDDPLLTDLAQRLAPSLQQMGELMFGEAIAWRIKEMWVNVLQPGGHQAVHNHANCFVSGVVYLSESHPSARTVFLRGLGGRDFSFSNSHAGTQPGPFNAEKWLAPPPAPGDAVLFPSYLLHEVPVNPGGVRISLAFNAIPQRLDAWGYTIAFGG